MDQKPKDWVDFTAAKAVRFEAALEALGLMEKMRREGEQWQGVCPLHKASGDKESFGVHLGKQTFNCFACKKHGKVLDFVMLYKEFGAKDAALWLLSLVDNREGYESVPVETTAGNGVGDAAKAALVVEPATVSGNAKLQLTEREEWLLGLMAHATAFAFAQLFKPLIETETVERVIMAMVELHGGVYEHDGNNAKQTIGRGEEEAADSSS